MPDVVTTHAQILGWPREEHRSTHCYRPDFNLVGQVLHHRHVIFVEICVSGLQVCMCHTVHVIHIGTDFTEKQLFISYFYIHLGFKNYSDYISRYLMVRHLMSGECYAIAADHCQILFLDLISTQPGANCVWLWNIDRYLNYDRNSFFMLLKICLLSLLYTST